jgi:hypothetical protein
MSNPRAIAAVTATLRRLLVGSIASEADLGDVVVTAQPLDKARDSTATNNQLNLFLYLIAPNAAWRNHYMPGHSKPGEVGYPPLALNLYYVLTAYGRDDDIEKPFSHLLLGHAMRFLYDHPLLGAAEIAASLQDNDLGDQVERVRITLQPLSIEEISRLWAGFQMQYRLSVAYEIGVALIESERPIRAAAPVLSRGPDGAGFSSSADPRAAYPTLDALAPQRPVRLGESLKLVGSGLSGDHISALINSVRFETPIETPATLDQNGAASVTLPSDAMLPPGPCLVSLKIDAGGRTRRTNQIPFMLAPKITSAMPVRISRAASPLALSVVPTPLAAQRVALILGDSEILAQTREGSTVRFAVDGVAPGVYLARLRVDGVDSLSVLDPQAARPVFDPSQTIEVTE